MRTVFVLLCLFVQEPDLDKDVARLTERLSDDQIEIRDAARRELIALGPAALPLIRRRAASSELEIRDRLSGVIREIERRERLKFFLQEPRKIRLKAERLPIGELLKTLATQSETPVKLNGVPPEEPVTVEIQDRPFFEALQEICLAHGGLVFVLPGESYVMESHDPVVISRGDPKACRPFVKGPFIVSLESLYTSGSILGPRKDQSHSSLVVAAGWERGIRPTRLKLDITSVVDETGTSYALPARVPREPLDIYVDRRESVQLVATPPASVTTFREIAGTIELEFPSDGHVARLEKPMGRKGVEAVGGPATFTLEEMVREGDRVRVALETGTWAVEDHLNRTRFFALDGLDRIYSQQGGHGKGTAAGKMRWTFSFEVPPDAEVKELRAVKVAIDKEHPSTVKFRWKLENVRFR